MKLRLGTRSSLLATTQSRQVASALEALGHSCELVTISTLGDEITDKPFAEVGPPGVFVREIEQALLNGTIDLAVHSYKDLPTTSPDGLCIAAVPERMDPADVLIIDQRFLLATEAEALPLARAARVGTSSARRRALLHDLRPDIEVAPLRGNVPTRLRKCREQDFAAIILAAAGLERLGSAANEAMQGLKLQRLDPASFVPAPSQGALAVQVREDSPARALIAAIDNSRAHLSAHTERQVLAALEGGCQTAIGVWLAWHDQGCTLHAALERNGKLCRSYATGQPNSLDRLTAQIIEELSA